MFDFDKMTPKLEAYLDLLEKRPGYKYKESRRGIPTPESKAEVEVWRDDLKRQKEALPKGLLDDYTFAKRVWLCRDETILSPLTQEHISPSGRYKLIVTHHTTGKNTWEYTRGQVFKDDQLVETIYRNYSSFPFSWIEGHGVTGHAYLIAGEDYQGQTIIDLTTLDRIDYLPKQAKYGAGFCWALHYPSPDGTLLAILGCHWGGSYQTVLYDFTDPMSPPWDVLVRADDSFNGWNEDNTCSLKETHDVVDIPGHPLHGKSEDDLSGEELGVVDEYASEHDLEGEGDDPEPGWKAVTRTWLWERNQK